MNGFDNMSMASLELSRRATRMASSLGHLGMEIIALYKAA